ncbi:MAG: AI-2E family transporter [Anaerolineales bacterium]|jgi:predicted PurR-regulated permease PerM
MSERRVDLSSPHWGTATKALVGMALMVLLGLLLWRFSHLIPLLLVAGIITFLVVPIIQFLHGRLRMPWGLAANLVMLIVILLFIGASTATGLAVFGQLQALVMIVLRFLGDLPEWLATLSQQHYVIGPWVIDFSQFDLQAFGEQLLAGVQPLLGDLSGFIASFTTGAIESLTRVFFTLAIAYFLTLDYRRIRAALIHVSLPGYEDDFRRLRTALSRIWRSFLRGQLLVVLLTGIITWTLMSLLGLRFSLGLGVLGGIAKFAPIVGPTTAGLVAALVALFQPGNWLGLTPLGHALLVIGCVIVLDQAIDYLLIPRIMGATLNLHPVVILIGVLVGASLAGVIGLLLSSPTIASLNLLSRYTYRKMLDLPAWDPPIDILKMPADQDPILVRAVRSLRSIVRRVRS